MPFSSDAVRKINKDLLDEYRNWIDSIENDLRAARILINESMYPYALYLSLLAWEKCLKIAYAMVTFNHVNEIGPKYGHIVFNIVLDVMNLSFKSTVIDFDEYMKQLRYLIAYLDGVADALNLHELRLAIFSLYTECDRITETLSTLNKSIDELKNLYSKILENLSVKNVNVMYLWFASMGIDDKASKLREQAKDVQLILEKFNDIKNSLFEIRDRLEKIHNDMRSILKSLHERTKNPAFALELYFLDALKGGENFFTETSMLLTEVYREHPLIIAHYMSTLRTLSYLGVVQAVIQYLINLLNNIDGEPLIFILATPIHLTWIRYPPNNYILRQYVESKTISERIARGIRAIKSFVSSLQRLLEVLEAIRSLDEMTQKLRDLFCAKYRGTS